MHGEYTESAFSGETDPLLKAKTSQQSKIKRQLVNVLRVGDSLLVVCPPPPL